MPRPVRSVGRVARAHAGDGPVASARRFVQVPAGSGGPMCREEAMIKRWRDPAVLLAAVAGTFVLVATTAGAAAPAQLAALGRRHGGQHLREPGGGP